MHIKNQEIKLSKYPIHSRVVGDLNYSYIKIGKGEPILFLHGFPDHAGSWDDIIESLSSHYTCIVPFLRGYFPTDISSDQDYSVKSIAKDIYLLAKELGYQRYSIVGHDWGASIAYAMANFFPYSVKKVVALNMPHPKFLKPSLTLLLKARHILYFMNKKKAPKRLSNNNYQYLDTLYHRWSPAYDYDTVKNQMMYCFNKAGRKEAALAYYQQLGKEEKEIISIYKELPDSSILVLAGQYDGTVDLKQFRQMECMPCFKVKYHPTSGHFLHREDPAYVVREIERFISDKAVEVLEKEDYVVC